MSPCLRRALGVSLLLALGLGEACTEATTELLPSGGGGGGTGGRDGGAARPPDASRPNDAALTDATAAPPSAQCGDHACACDDGLDQDGDTLVDGLDSECTGPFDDDEASFGTGAAGTDLPACQGCFWHGRGAANADVCSRPLDCVFDSEPPSALVASCGGCTAPATCAQSCLPSTPNGCDCFGCCEASTPQGPVHVLLAGSCSLQDLTDEQKCPRCTPSPDCQNPCGTCELCGNKKRRDLARECRGMPSEEPVNTCDDQGQRVCDEANPCPETSYCQLGCCRIVVL